MFQGQRLSYIVPGYTGHIPKRINQEFVPIQPQKPISQIPGYAGYVHAIKPQNLHANTFGKITYNVSDDTYVRGQDIATRYKYVSTASDVNIPPSQMLQRTAASIVGVPDKKIEVKEPRIHHSVGPQKDQFSISKTSQFQESMKNTNTKWGKSSLVVKQGKEYVQLGNPLPGYTGFGKRVLANNIFGKTFAECRKESLIDDQKLKHQKQKNFNQQLNSDPPLKF